MSKIPRVKICGMRTASDVEIAVNCGADAVGFITDVPVNTPRKIDAQTASELVKKVPAFVSSVLVIMPKDGDEALGLIDAVGPDIVQLHNDIGTDDIELIRNETNRKLVKVMTIPVGEEFVVDNLLSKIDSLAGNDLVDAILLDSGKAGRAGGTGTVHDWSVSKEIVDAVDVPVILAGGLKPENVRDAVEQVRPFAVDTASGVETEGKKDPAKVCRFVREARCING
ncbi:phosphoribosylanthranilate isomerase [Methanolobus zinderi]|uniref:N-(5'-phosphoribosyl)anthranilate isomerase n=1 Tax=Methanolobus zinderi TaxID=536044 RepID=A0A7D5ICP1_9EURY|nr:phosphoribosylanthranilate isomerase [Methanolobus zinderi]QLC50909.1 phosphoribosylanthranilate isomerase [Methanolobus zinderi]